MSTVKRMKYRPKTPLTGKKQSSKLRFVSKDGERQEINVEDIRKNLEFLKENKDLQVKDIASGSEIERQFNTFRTRCDFLYKTNDYSRLMSLVSEVFSKVLVHPGTIGAFIAGNFVEDIGKGFRGPEKYNPIRAAAIPSTNTKTAEKIDKRILLYFPETDGRIYQTAGSASEEAYVFIYLSGNRVDDIGLDSSSLKSSGVKSIYVYTYNEASREFNDITQSSVFVDANSALKVSSNVSSQQESVQPSSMEPESKKSSSWLLLLLVFLLVGVVFVAGYFYLR